jgi:hypothetical protein
MYNFSAKGNSTNPSGLVISPENILGPNGRALKDQDLHLAIQSEMHMHMRENNMIQNYGTSPRIQTEEHSRGYTYSGQDNFPQSPTKKYAHMASSGMKPPMHHNQPGNSTVNFSNAFSNNSIENANQYIY